VVITIYINKDGLVNVYPLDRIDLHMKDLEVMEIMIQQKEENVWKNGHIIENIGYISNTYSISFDDSENEKFYPGYLYDIRI
jgi:hypothetical protein